MIHVFYLHRRVYSMASAYVPLFQDFLSCMQRPFYASRYCLCKDNVCTDILHSEEIVYMSLSDLTKEFLYG